VLFVDEVDALGRRRLHLTHSAGRTLINQLLSEMDGFAGRNEGVFVLGATNHPWDLDPALRRPGRFARMVTVRPPEAAARRRILELKLRGRPVAPGLDLGRLTKATDGYTGADLEAIVETAVELGLERSVRQGVEQPIDEAQLQKALRDVRPSARPWLETARNYAIYANEGGVYDELLAHLRSVGLG
jgi:SpoVK/Ycf46/Vps4 family AAA+-type ATPase